jgi:outer membrane lipoprotein-sorting protein
MRSSFAVVLLLAACASAQDSTGLLKQVVSLYAELPKSTYDLELVEARESPGHHLTTEDRWRIAGSGGRYRQENLSSGKLLYVFDGHALWSYNQERNEYRKLDGDLYGRTLPSMLESFLVRNLNTGHYLRQETLPSATGPVVCQVFEVTVPHNSERAKYSPYTYWIDPSTKLVMKFRYTVDIQSDFQPEPSRTTVTLSLSKAQVAQPVSEDLFRFTLPEGAQQVDQLTFGAKSPLSGKSSPEFSLKTTDGVVMTNESLRGKVVLLHFSPSWESDLTLLTELAHRALKAYGFTAIQVIPRLAANVDAAFTAPIAVDADGVVAKKFGISQGGTVLINRSGTVVYAETQDSSPRLAKALQEAGAW